MKHKRTQSGFSYIIVLVAVLLVGIMAQVTYQQSSYLRQRDNEAELLFRGTAYRNAIKAYYNANPTLKRYPKRLDDLLEDPRQPGRRFLRQLYSEPVSQDGQWVLLHGQDDSIVGVASPSEDEPLKQAEFPLELMQFEKASRYRDWEFSYFPKSKTAKTK
jgi:type II secretory pathway pseudopilin PulG